jgi:hypothetical protein
VKFFADNKKKHENCGVDGESCNFEGGKVISWECFVVGLIMIQSCKDFDMKDCEMVFEVFKNSFKILSQIQKRYL